MKTINTVHLLNEPYNLSDLVTRVRHDLSTIGYIVLKNFGHGRQNISQTFLDFCSRIATPVPHNMAGNIIWDIKPRVESNSSLTTFSEHNEEAFLHTDSQYSKRPEDIFGLLCLRSARCGGGKSLLLSLKSVLNDMKQTTEGLNYIKILMSEKFRFITPSVFNDGVNTDYAEHYILSNHGIRFRADTIEKAFALYPDYYSAPLVDAYRFIKNKIQNSKAIIEYNLEDEDLILINNSTMLHGRESFYDMLRHLLRIRMIF
ncbi:TauD/TfdA family dioxygenase [Mucilaginibacter mali]|uniref:TauD/TfdA family dioxygenase n=1 Tax=Mucilaginibacter mali TaxID=2740462 RepID=A0A7D4PWX6_9SPHI|nr:TauD/TfdA family dioxygenase [Mucilaginibacter mali]QKJ32868.1 TauD/TfdA family dioxygenase [Mucilaginibacter mali]